MILDRCLIRGASCIFVGYDISVKPLPRGDGCVMASTVSLQAVDPGSIPGHRITFYVIGNLNII